MTEDGYGLRRFVIAFGGGQFGRAELAEGAELLCRPSGSPGEGLAVANRRYDDRYRRRRHGYPGVETIRRAVICHVQRRGSGWRGVRLLFRNICRIASKQCLFP